MGSATTQGRPATRIGAAGRVAFRSGDGVGALIGKFSKLDTQPIFPPVYASLDTSQHPAQNSGPSGSLLLSRKALSSSTPCRFIPAHHHIFSRHGFNSWFCSKTRIVSRPTLGTNLRLTASSTIKRTVQRARPPALDCKPWQCCVVFGNPREPRGHLAVALSWAAFRPLLL